MDTCWIFVFLHYFDMPCVLDMHMYSFVCVLYLFLFVFMCVGVLVCLCTGVFIKYVHVCAQDTEVCSICEGLCVCFPGVSGVCMCAYANVMCFVCVYVV